MSAKASSSASVEGQTTYERKADAYERKIVVYETKADNLEDEIAAIKEGAGLYSGLTNEKKLDAIKSKEDAILACMTAIHDLRQLQARQQGKFNKGQFCLFLFSFFIYSPECFVFLYECFSPE